MESMDTSQLQTVAPKAEDGQQSDHPAEDLFNAVKDTFSKILHNINYATTDHQESTYNALRFEFRRFYLWNEGFSTSTGNLDAILSRSKNLKATVLQLLVQWAKIVLKCRTYSHI